MIQRRWSLLAWSSLGLATLGCALPAEVDEAEVAEQAQAMVSDNGRSLNGRSLNGRSLNGRSLNGRSLNGVSLGGVVLKQGTTTVSTWLDGTTLQGVDALGKKLSKKDFLGARFVGRLDDDSTIELRIDGIGQSPSEPSIHLYAVTYATDAGPQPICRDANDQPTFAIPLEGRWSYAQGVPGGGARIADPASFTFACRGYALAKCAELGYGPWRTFHGPGNNKLPLAAHHQACTRLIRADYFGDGRSFTVDGALLNLYDGLGIQEDTEAWSFEAEWGPEGARCVSHARGTQGSDSPEWAALVTPDCGLPAHFATGTLLMNEDAWAP